jgi:outer membrane lipoprotein-sorting protein
VRRSVLLLVLLAAGPLWAEDADGLVSRHLRRLDDLQTLVLRVERRTTVGGQSATERWTVRQKGSDKFRIDVEFPTARRIVCDGASLWEYLPAAGKAALTHLGTLGEKDRKSILQATLRRVALDGLRFEAGASEAPLRSLGERQIAGRLAVGVECTGRREAKERVVRGWIDAERLVLVACEFVEGGQAVMRTESSGFAEAAPGLWFPRQITVERLGPRGSREVVTLTATANGELPDELFQFQVPQGVEVVGERR